MRLTYNKALVTGGAGFIGSHIVDRLLANKCDVTIIDNLSTGRMENIEHVQGKITFIEGDIQDKRTVEKAAEGCEVVFHQAAVVSVPQTVEQPIESAMVNDIGTLNILETARQNDVKRVVIASSCAVYGDDPALPKTEEMRVLPKTPYAVQKYTGELNARVYFELYGLKTVCLRYFNVFGPRQDPSSHYSGVISIFMSKAIAEQQPIIYGDGNQSRDFVFVKDVVRANLLASLCEGSAGKCFNIGTGNFIKIKTLWETISKMNMTTIAPEYKSARPGDIRESFADIGRAKDVLGYEPEYSFENGLKQTCDWYKEAL